MGPQVTTILERSILLQTPSLVVQVPVEDVPGSLPPMLPVALLALLLMPLLRGRVSSIWHKANRLSLLHRRFPRTL